MNVLLYSAEQLLSNDHAELIHHLYNARILLDEYLRESMHNEYSISYTQTVNSHLEDLKLTNIDNVLFTFEDVDDFSSPDHGTF